VQRCDDPATWMEIYEGIADWDGFAAAMQVAVAAARVSACTQGDRQIECFQQPD
jgi:hypothetical protein